MKCEEAKLSKHYTYPPDNISEVEEYVIYDKGCILDYLLRHDDYFFYDACTFRYHMNIDNPAEILSFFLDHKATIVIISTIMSELTFISGMLGEKEITYLRRIHEAGIKVLLISEEWMIDVLRECYSGFEKVNALLAQSIKEAVPTYSEVRDLIKSKKVFNDAFLIGKASSNSEIGYRLFEEVIKNKKANDDLGETMILLCVRMLLFRPSDDIRVSVLSDDKEACRQLGKLISRINGRLERLCSITTPKLCWILNRKYGVENPDVIYSLLDCVSGVDSIRVLCSGEYDLTPSERTFEKRELTRLITNDRIFTVFL